MTLPRTLGELAGFRLPIEISVKNEMRPQSLLRKMKAQEPDFDGIIGYEDTVLRRSTTPSLSRHDMLFLGLRGQAKTTNAPPTRSSARRAAAVVAGSEVQRRCVSAPLRIRPRSSSPCRVDEHADRCRIGRTRYRDEKPRPNVTMATICIARST